MHLTRRGKRRFLLVLAIFMVLVVTFSALFVYRDVRSNQLAIKNRTQGLEAYHAGDYESALIQLQYPLNHDRNDLEILLAFADSRSKVIDANNSHLAFAASLYQEALQLDPENLKALEQLLVIYGRLRYRVEALDVVDRILSLDPEHIDALSAKYAILFATIRGGEPLDEDPVQYARRLMALEPDQINWYKFQLEMMRQNEEPSEALIALCDEWVDAYEGDGRFLLLKAEMLLVLGRFEDSRRTARLAAQRGASSLEILDLTLSLLDVLSLQTRSNEELINARAELLNQTKARFADQSWVYEAMIRQYWRGGDYTLALETLDEAEAAIGMLNDRLLRWLTLLNTASDQRSEAIAALDRLDQISSDATTEQRDGNRAWSQAVRARLTVGESSWPVVIERLKRAIELSQSNPILQYLLAEAYQNVDEHELAANSFLRAIRSDPLWHQPYVSCARSLLTVGRPQEAIGVLLNLLRRTPNVSLEPYVLFAEAWLAAGRSTTVPGYLYDRQGRSIDLLSLLGTLRRETGGDPQVTRLLMEAHLAIGDEKTTEQLLRTILDNDAPDVATLLVLADVSRAAGFGLEETCLRRASELATNNIDVVAARAILLDDQGQGEKGLELIDRAIRDLADDPGQLSWARRSRVAYLLRIDHPEALSALNDLLNRESESHGTALFVLSSPIAWQDAALIERAIEQLATNAGEFSPRVIISRAHAELRFHEDDPARLAVALSNVIQLLETTPNSLPALTLMVELLLVGQDPDPIQATRFLRTAVDNYPTVWSLYPRLIELLQQQGNYDAADEYLQRFGRRTSDVAALRQSELKLLQVQGDFETIVIRLRDSLETGKSTAEELLLADMYRRTGQPLQAEQVYLRLLDEHPDNATVVSQTAEFFTVINQHERAMTLLDSFESEEQPERKQLLLGRFHEWNGDLERAGRHYEQAHDLNPSSLEATDQLARYRIITGASQQALTLVAEGLERDSSNEALRFTQALASLNMGPEGRRQALVMIEQLGESHRPWLETERLNDRVMSSAAPSKPNNRDLEDARLLVNNYEQYLPAWRLAVTFHANAGLVPDAIQLSRRAAANLPLSQEPIEWTTQLFVQSGLRNEALDSARLWRQRTLQDPINADIIIASLFIDLGRSDDALAQLDPHHARIEREEFRFPERMASWLRVLLHESDYARALPLLTNHQQAREMWYPLCREREPAVANEALQLAESVRGSSPREAYLLANEWTLLGHRAQTPEYFDKAESLCRIAESEESLTLQLHLLRAMIASGRGDYAQSVAYYRRALQLQPDHPGMLNNLAFALLQRDPHSTEALALASRAVQIAPGNPDLLDTHAQALLGVERLDNAARAAELAVSLRDDDPAFRLTLARIRLRQKRYDEVQILLHRIQLQLNSMPRRDEKLWDTYRFIDKQIQESLATVSP